MPTVITGKGGGWYRGLVPERWQEGLRSVGGRSLVEATFWNGTGTVASRGAQILAMMFAARALGPANFGVLGMLLATVAAVQAIAGLALGGTTTKYVAQFRTVDRTRAGRVVAIGHVLSLGGGALCALALVLLAPRLSLDVMRDAALTPRLRIFSLVALLTGLLETQSGALAGLQGFRRIAFANFATGAFTLPAILVAARAGGLDGVVWALVGAGLFSCVAMGAMLRLQLREEGLRMVFQGMWNELPLLWRFALPSLLVGAASMPVTWLCQTVLLRRSGYVEVALFTAANQWYGVVAFLPGIFGAVVLPRLSESYGRGNRTELRRLSTLGIAVTAGIAGVLCGVFVVLAPFLMRAYGAEFSRGTLVLDLVVACAGVTVVMSSMGQGLAAVDRMWSVALCNLGWAGAFVAATLGFVDRGAVGLALARLLAQLLYFAGVVWFYQRHVSTRTAAWG